MAVEDKYLEKVKELFLEKGIKASLWTDEHYDGAEVLIVPREFLSEGMLLIELEGSGK